MAEQGVIAESIISFAITWKNPGKGQQPLWDQTKQSIEIHETDVYPDLKYSSAYGAPQYVKYTSGSLLNDLIVEIDKIIDARIAMTDKDKKKADPAKNEAALPPGPKAPKALGSGEEEDEDDLTQKALPSGPKAPKALGSGEEEDDDDSTQKALPAGPNAQKALGSGEELSDPTQKARPTGPAAPNQLGQGSSGGALVKYDQPQPPAVIDNKPKENDEPDVKDEEPKSDVSGEYAYTVVVRGDKLRFIEGQQDRGAYSGGVKFLYKVSNNLTKQTAGEQIDNKPKIWAEITMAGAFGGKFKMTFDEFNEKDFRFGGNLLAQILPSIELSFTPEINSVYSKEKTELDLADVIKATNITLGSKSTSEIMSIQKQIQKELSAREPDQKEKSSGKQVDQDQNK